MKLSQMVCKINKIMLNVIKYNMTSFFHNGAKNFFEILSTLARYNSGFHIYIKTGIYFILYPISYQNIKTELKSSSKLYRFPPPGVQKSQKSQVIIGLRYSRFLNCFLNYKDIYQDKQRSPPQIQFVIGIIMSSRRTGV